VGPVTSTQTSVWRRVRAHLDVPLFHNAYALVASGAGSTLLGLAFWALAVRFYPAAEVGRASAAVSAMTMLAAVLQLNLNVGLIRFLPDAGRHARSLLLRAYLFSSATALLGAVVAVIVLADRAFFVDLGTDALAFTLLFVVSVPLWSLFVLQDSALIGLRSAVVVPVKNLIFSVAKIVLLVLLAWWPTGGLLAAWVLAAAVLVVPVNVLILRRLLPARAAEPVRVRSWSQVRGYLAADYLGSLLEIVFAALLPILVVWQLGLVPAAYFYTSWMVLVGIEAVLDSIGSSLIVEGARDRDALHGLRRSATRVTALIVAAAVVIGIPFAPLLLRVIGQEYADHGTTLFRLLILAVPLRAIVVLHLSAARVQKRGRVVLGYQGGNAVLLIAGSVLALGPLGIDGVGWVFLAVQVLLLTAMAVERVLRGRPVPEAA
jgi:O-antigen/teichoic acid export membrane protein